ncbi:MAG: RHS repeat-associated core domain-containing protein, partial [Candidatus Saccharimonadales bacterium]
CGLGRFLSVDPLIGHPESTQGINPYSYVANNPLNATDPTGQEEVSGNACTMERCHNGGQWSDYSSYKVSAQFANGTSITGSLQQMANTSLSQLNKIANNLPGGSALNLDSNGVASITNPNAANGTSVSGHSGGGFNKPTMAPSASDGAWRGGGVSWSGMKDTMDQGLSAAENYIAGFGDTLSFGLTADIRGWLNNAMGLGGYGTVDASSAAYRYSGYAAVIMPVGGTESLLFRGAKEAAYTIKEGDIVNRVWDSRWTFGSKYSGPKGGSYTRGGYLPINAKAAIEDRGLRGFPNNAQRGALFRATRDIPATLRQSIGGSENELVVPSQFRQYLDMMQEESHIPAGGG